MKLRISHATTLTAVGAIAFAVAVAPTAAADDMSSNTCNAEGGGTECRSPGNVEIYDSPPPIDFDPYGDYGLAIGSLGGGNDFHGGGSHR
jgi:hypothetical protein